MKAFSLNRPPLSSQFNSNISLTHLSVKSYLICCITWTSLLKDSISFLKLPFFPLVGLFFNSSTSIQLFCASTWHFFFIFNEQKELLLRLFLFLQRLIFSHPFFLSLSFHLNFLFLKLHIFFGRKVKKNPLIFFFFLSK